MDKQANLSKQAKVAEKEWRDQRKTRKIESRKEFWEFVKRNELEQEYQKCVICGWAEVSIDLAHIYPYAEGGSHSYANIIPLCPNHHRVFDKKGFGRNRRDKINAFICKVHEKIEINMLMGIEDIDPETLKRGRDIDQERFEPKYPETCPHCGRYRK